MFGHAFRRDRLLNLLAPGQDLVGPKLSVCLNWPMSRLYRAEGIRLERLVWSPEWTVGDVRLDREHQQLIAMINRLSDAQPQGLSLAEAHPLWNEMLSDLVRYAENHFRHEELIMLESNFPKLLPHKDSHMRFRRQVSEMALQRNGNADDLEDLLAFLASWLKHHVFEEDKQYVPYLKHPQEACG
jgi:hemerythrin